VSVLDFNNSEHPFVDALQVNTHCLNMLVASGSEGHGCQGYASLVEVDIFLFHRQQARFVCCRPFQTVCPTLLRVELANCTASGGGTVMGTAQPALHVAQGRLAK